MKPLEFTTVKPLEFTTVSVEDARRALEGEPTKPGASQLTVKRTQTPKEPLLDITRTWLESLPQDIRPMELARQFPRIANRLRHVWTQVATCEGYLDGLLVDHRCNRKGFPLKITQELESLREYYTLLHPTRRSIWDYVDERR